MKLLASCILLCSVAASAQATLKQLLSNARRGDAASEIAVADAYYKGLGTSQNFRKAADWYSAAAQDGSAYASFMLGQEYYLNQLPETRGLLRIPIPDTQRNMNLAFVYMSAAANMNYGPACAWMGWYTEEGYRIGRSDIETSANTTEQASQSRGGLIGAGDGSSGVHTNASINTNLLAAPQYDNAAVWYRRGADQGDAACEYSLGRLYEHGLGFHQNSALAMKWYSAAAAKGHEGAKIRLELLQEQSGRPDR